MHDLKFISHCRYQPGLIAIQSRKNFFCVLEDELLSAEDELFRKEGQIVVII